MRARVLLVLLAFTSTMFFISGCDKDSDPGPQPPPIDPSKFSMKINGNTWVPTELETIYYAAYRQISIEAKDTINRIVIVIDLDTTNFNRAYTFAAFGGSVAKFDYNNTAYFTYVDVTEAGGSLSLSSFSTNGTSITGSGSLVVSSEDKLKTLQLTDINFKDLPVFIETQNTSVGTATYTISGKKSANINTMDVYSNLFCSRPDIGLIASIRIMSPLSLANEHYLLFQLPINGVTGTFTVYPSPSGGSACSADKVLSAYNLQNNKNLFQPVSGTITIIKSDTVARTIRASFELTLKNNSNPQETLTIQNGQFEVNKWQ